MNFLKISGLIVGTGSVVGGTGAGIYYAVNKKNIKVEKIENKADQKALFVGKLVFVKKSGTGNDINYEMKLLSEKEYSAEVSTFDSSASKGIKYEDVNKIVDISHSLNFENTKTELGSIFTEPLTLEGIKSKISSQENELKSLFNDDIYTKLKTKFGVLEN